MNKDSYQNKYNKKIKSKNTSCFERKLLKACNDTYADDAIKILKDALNLMTLKKNELQKNRDENFTRMLDELGDRMDREIIKATKEALADEQKQNVKSFS